MRDRDRGEQRVGRVCGARLAQPERAPLRMPVRSPPAPGSRRAGRGHASRCASRAIPAPWPSAPASRRPGRCGRATFPRRRAVGVRRLAERASASASQALEAGAQIAGGGPTLSGSGHPSRKYWTAAAGSTGCTRANAHVAGPECRRAALDPLNARRRGPRAVPRSRARPRRLRACSVRGRRGARSWTACRACTQ